LARPAQREGDDVARLVRARERADHGAVPADVGHAQHVLALGHRADLPAAHGREVQVARALAAYVEVDAAPVARPGEALRRAVEALAQQPRVRAVGLHYVEVRLDVRVVRPVVAG